MTQDNHALQKEELPYERFMQYGAHALSNAELLAILLRTGCGGDNATALAKKILGFQFGNAPTENNGKLSILYDLSLSDLMSIKGIGEVKAVRLLVAAELSRRLSQERCERKLQFTSPQSIAEYYMERLRHEPQEHVLLVLLDNHLQRIGEEILSVGTATNAPVSPRDVFRLALRYRAVHIVLLHNHPSGDPTPSDADLALTNRIAMLGTELEVSLLDHLIIGDGQWISLHESGQL